MDQLNEAHEQGVVLGLANVSGIAQRLDIDELLLHHPDTFNLFLIALIEMQGLEVPWETPKEYAFSPDDKLSYFQIAGIHGLPATTWDGEDHLNMDYDDTDKDKKYGWPAGYCAHGTPTFALWHRPYLAMLEQTLYRQIANVAKRFSESPNVSEQDKQKYMAAVDKFRLPYWDYFRPRGGQKCFPGVKDGSTTTAPYGYDAPQIFTLPRVMVKSLLDNKLVDMANPLFKFDFVKFKDPKDPRNINWARSTLNTNSVLNSEVHTLRHANKKGESDPEAMNTVLNKIREDEMRACLVMIEDEAYSNFQVISSTGAHAGLNMDQEFKFDGFKEICRSRTGSLESLHNDYHVYMGGFSGRRDRIFKDKKNPEAPLEDQTLGHLSCVPVSAYDPLFFFHHCQVDRLFAIWQAANPMGADDDANNGTDHWFNELEKQEERDLVDKPLYPFRKAPKSEKEEDRYWTPNRARDTKTFGYEYADTAGKHTRKEVRKEFARKYGWSTRRGVNQSFRPPPKDMLPLDVCEAQVFQYTSADGMGKLLKPLLPPLDHDAVESVAQESTESSSTVAQEWYIDLVVERMAANGSFTVFYIIGDVGGDSGREWAFNPGFVGVSHIFASPKEACDNCGRQDQQAKIVTSTTPITSLLLDYVKIGKLQSLDPEEVKPFLIKKLKWRVQTTSGEKLNPRKLDKSHVFKLSISRKTAPAQGQEGKVEYSVFTDIIEEIVKNSSPTMDSGEA